MAKITPDTVESFKAMFKERYGVEYSIEEAWEATHNLLGFFELRLMQNIIALHEDLAAKRYRHSAYEAFNVSDPKPRNIHKASVRDRLLHHAIYRVLYPFFDRTFIVDSFSCRFRKGMHKAVDRFRTFARKASSNHTKTVWVLKCDIRKFFASIDQKVPTDIIKEYISDRQTASALASEENINQNSRFWR